MSHSKTRNRSRTDQHDARNLIISVQDAAKRLGLKDSSGLAKRMRSRGMEPFSLGSRKQYMTGEMFDKMRKLRK